MTHADELKSNGLKATLPRIKVLEMFQKSRQRHMSAEDVFKMLLAEGADVGLATVYRVLMQLEEAGVLRRSNFNPSKAVFELAETTHHDHLICLGCGRADEFTDPAIEKRQKAVADSFGYTLSDHQLALYGHCAACTAERTSEESA